MFYLAWRNGSPKETERYPTTYDMQEITMKKLYIYAALTVISVLLTFQFSQAATDIRIIFDNSGSMQGERCEQANQAVKDAVEKLEVASSIAELGTFQLTTLNNYWSDQGLDEVLHSYDISDVSKIQSLRALMLNDFNIHCDGGTPLAQSIDKVTGVLNLLARIRERNVQRSGNVVVDTPTTQEINNQIILIFADGANDNGQEPLVRSLENILSKANGNSVSVYFFGIQNNVVWLNQEVTTGERFGSFFFASKLSQPEQLTRAFDQALARFINSELIKKLQGVSSDIQGIRRNIDFTRAELRRAERVLGVALPVDIDKAIEGLKGIETEMDASIESASGDAVQKLSLDFKRFMAQLKDYEDLPRQLNARVRQVRETLEESLVARVEIQKNLERLADLGIFLQKLKEENSEEYESLRASHPAAINSIESGLETVMTDVSNMNARKKDLVDQASDLKSKLISLDAAKAEFEGIFSRILAKLGREHGDDQVDRLKSLLAQNGYSVRENGEIVLYGTHVFGGGNSKNPTKAQGKPVVVRNKGTIVNLGGGGGSGRPVSKLINDGLIVNSVERSSTGQNGHFTLFINNGDVISLSYDNYKNRMSADCSWAEYKDGYVIVCNNFENIYFVGKDKLLDVTSKRRWYHRLGGFVGILGTTVYGAVTTIGGGVLDILGGLHEAATGYGHGDGYAPVISRNWKVAGRWYRHNWVALKGPTYVIHAPEQIIPVLREIAELTES